MWNIYRKNAYKEAYKGIEYPVSDAVRENKHHLLNNNNRIMNKYKTLGVALMVSIILAILSATTLGYTSIQWAISGIPQFLLFLSGLCIILFGSFSALTLNKLK
jgi:uncharacterized protein involved in cysteine biosynthesis